MLKYVLNVIIYLALAVLIGSICFFGAGVAATLFQPGLLPSKTIAGAVNSVIIRKLGLFEIGAGVFLVGGTLYTAFRYRHWMNWAVLVISAAMLVATFYYTSIVFPEANATRIAIGDFDSIPAEKMVLKKQFDDDHIIYSRMTSGVLIGGILVLILHTIAFVRYTELHARKYREIEKDLQSYRKGDVTAGPRGA
jgi:hypothetical protein